MPGLFRRPPRPQQRFRSAVNIPAPPPETNAPAELASGTGSAFNASISVAPNAGLGSVTSTAQAAAPSVAPNAGAVAVRGGLVGDLSGFLDARSTAGVALRLRSSSPGFGVSYLAVVLASGSDVELRISRYDSPTSTTLASVIVFTSESIDQRWNVRFDVWGEPTAVVARARLWHDADAEPTTWHVGATDNYPTGARADLYEGDLLGGSGTLHEASVVYILPPPSISIAISAGLGSVTGTANQPSASVAPVAGHAAVTVAAYDATTTSTVETNASAGHAAVTVAANQPSASVAPSAGLGSVAGAANAPAISTTDTADAGNAAATATSHQPSASVSVNAGHAAVVAAAFGPSVSLALGPDVAAVTVAAYDATVAVTGSTNVNAGHAAVVASAWGATADTGQAVIPPLGGLMQQLTPHVFAYAGAAHIDVSTGGSYVQAEWLLDELLLDLGDLP